MSLNPQPVEISLPTRTDMAMPFNSSPCMGAEAQMRQRGLCAPVRPGGVPFHTLHTYMPYIHRAPVMQL